MSGILAPRSDNDALYYGSKAKVTCRDTIGYARKLEGNLSIEGDSTNNKKTFPFDILEYALKSLKILTIA